MSAHATLAGKTICGFGDSLIAGHYNGIGMLHHIANKNHMIFHNYAINGASVLPREPYKLPDMEKIVLDIGTQIDSAPYAPCDFICFDGLTNDAYDEISRNAGTISDSYDGCYDTATFCGAFETICYKLRKKYPDSIILYICPHKMPTRTIFSQQTLQCCVRQICEKWSIPYVDMYRSGGINTYIEDMRKTFSYNGRDETCDGNGTHLNEQGYRLWYAPAIEAALLTHARSPITIKTNNMEGSL